MHNKIHSVISPLFRIKNADTETGWNVQILRSVWIISAEIRYLLSEQKKFQNKSKNIDEVYQSVFFRCIIFLSYRVTFLCNVLGQIHYTSESPVRYFFYEKVVKWCTITSISKRTHEKTLVFSHALFYYHTGYSLIIKFCYQNTLLPFHSRNQPPHTCYSHLRQKSVQVRLLPPRRTVLHQLQEYILYMV